MSGLPALRADCRSAQHIVNKTSGENRRDPRTQGRAAPMNAAERLRQSGKFAGIIDKASIKLQN
jgi:hypothetical protein